MDFLCLELLRQKRALAKLLLGGQEAEPEDAPSLDARAFNGAAVRSSRNSARAASGVPAGGSGLADIKVPSESRAFAVDSDALHYSAVLKENRFLQQVLSPSLPDSVSGLPALPVPGTAPESPSEYAPFGEPAGLPDSSGAAGSGSDAGFGTAVPGAWYASGGGFHAASAVGTSIGSLRGPGFVGASDGFDAARAVSRAFQRDARRYDGGFLS